MTANARYRLISIHALLAESDGYRPASWSDFRDFYPRSPCGERRYNSGLRAYFHHISIHALLAESDTQTGNSEGNSNISIHALLAESDPRRLATVDSAQVFLSTLSLRRATCFQFSPCPLLYGFLSTLSLRRATVPGNIVLTNVLLFLSTLSLRRATLPDLRLHSAATHFYPRSPCGERLCTFWVISAAC